ncbi:MAG: hypothetical protein KAJ42_15345 [Gemmatimonadetes bacterium]|nr:hypothetical protein [Gemmatimonadota bacterium]
MPRKTRQLEGIDFPTALDPSVVDLTDIATTEYPSGMLDVRQYFIFTLIIDIIETTTTPATGDMSVRLEVLKKDKSTVLWLFDLLTAIDTSNNAQQEVLVFGAGAAAKLSSASSGILSADADVFKQAEYMQLVLEITTQANGDAAANVNLLMEG